MLNSESLGPKPRLPAFLEKIRHVEFFACEGMLVIWLLVALPMFHFLLCLFQQSRLLSIFLLMSKVCVWERCLGFRSKRRGCRLFLCRGIMPLSHFGHCFLGVRQSKKSSTCRTFLDYCRQIFVSYSVRGSGSFLLCTGNDLWTVFGIEPPFACFHCSKIRHVEFCGRRKSRCRNLCSIHSTLACCRLELFGLIEKFGMPNFLSNSWVGPLRVATISTSFFSTPSPTRRSFGEWSGVEIRHAELLQW